MGETAKSNPKEKGPFKRPREKRQRKGRKSEHHETLETQILADTRVLSSRASRKGLGSLAAKGLKTNKVMDVDIDVENEESDQLIDEKSTNKILNSARLQQLEIESEEKGAKDWFKCTSKDEDNGYLSQKGRHSSSSDEENIMGYNPDEAMLEQMSHKDRLLFEKFTKKSNDYASKSLSDLILEKLEQTNRTQIANDDFSDNYDNQKFEGGSIGNKDAKSSELNGKIVQVYQKLGLLLSRYKSGKLPKAFKILPALNNWTQILAITEPEKWTPNAVYQATRLFSSNLKANLAQRFYSAVLLPHVRKDIQESKKLNVHLYAALKKAIYKPGAFFKAVLIPLCESGDGTLREAVILGSVLSRTSLPVLHASVALLKLSEMPYSGANSVFIRSLLDKKYTLPYRVIDALVDHFDSFKDEVNELFVLWHQSLLVFVERYKDELTENQKERLLHLIKVKQHHAISPEVLRELNSSTLCRGYNAATKDAAVHE